MRNLKTIKMDKITLLWNFYSEQRIQGRSFDSQRTSIGNFVITVSGALLVLSVNSDFDKKIIPFTVFIMIISFYGFWATIKLFERQEYHYKRARNVLKKIEEFEGEEIFHQIINQSSLEHYKKRGFSSKLPAYIVWLILHSLIFIFGLITLLIVL